METICTICIANPFQEFVAFIDKSQQQKAERIKISVSNIVYLSSDSDRGLSIDYR